MFLSEIRSSFNALLALNDFLGENLPAEAKEDPTANDQMRQLLDFFKDLEQSEKIKTKIFPVVDGAKDEEQPNYFDSDPEGLVWAFLKNEDEPVLEHWSRVDSERFDWWAYTNLEVPYKESNDGT